MSEANWKAVQKRTFTRWVNQQLKERNMEVKDISVDFRDGVALCNLMEILTKKKVGKFKKKPKMRIHKVENCQMAINRMKKEGMKVVNIGGTDIAGSDEKLIMGVLWQLILKYEINKGGSGNASDGRNKLLKWVRKQIPGYNITNFTTNWNDGRALNALNNSIKPGLCANHRKLDPNDALNNARRGMDVADQVLGVGMLIDPEDLINPKIDEKLMMTYLAQYIDATPKEPEDPVLTWVQEKIPEYNIQNFTTDWIDGRAINALNDALQSGLCANHRKLNPKDRLNNVTMGMDRAAAMLDITPLIKPKDMIKPKGDGELVKEYIAQYMNATPNPLLGWVQEQIPEYKISNFTTDWNDGRALNALNNAIQPGLCPNHAELNPRNGLDNIMMAMNVGEQALGISLLVKPDDMINPHVNEQDMMAHISQYMDVKPEPLLAWVREKIPEYNIQNFTTDWNDGRALNALNNAIVPGLCANHRKLNRRDRLNNVNTGMNVASQALGVSKLMQPEDMIDPNVDEMAMMEYLVQYMTVEQDPLLEWVRDKIPEYNIQNFTTDWNDGRALNALNNALQPGLCIDHAKLNPNDQLQNIGKGMDVAEQALGVSKLIRPKDMADPGVDEVAMKNHIGQYMAVKPNPLLGWIQEKIPEYRITNLTTDWNDGVAINALNNALMPGLCSGHGKLDPTCQFENADQGINTAAQVLNVSKLITPEQMINPKVGQTDMENYLGQFMAATPPENMAMLCSAWGNGLEYGVANRPMHFGLSKPPGCTGNFDVKVQGPNGMAPVTITATGEGGDEEYDVCYTPDEPGNYMVSVTLDGEHIPGSVFALNVLPAHMRLFVGSAISSDRDKAMSAIEASIAAGKDLDGFEDWAPVDVLEKKDRTEVFNSKKKRVKAFLILIDDDYSMRHLQNNGEPDGLIEMSRSLGGKSDEMINTMAQGRRKKSNNDSKLPGKRRAMQSHAKYDGGKGKKQVNQQSSKLPPKKPTRPTRKVAKEDPLFDVVRQNGEKSRILGDDYKIVQTYMYHEELEKYLWLYESLEKTRKIVLNCRWTLDNLRLEGERKGSTTWKITLPPGKAILRKMSYIEAQPFSFALDMDFEVY